ncbi:hypothetical protein ACCQ05_21125 [Xanthomonas sp. NCPPB 3582]|uniref:hypothetical protein n=1 Tax=Xanthomonas sp. NCPPB 3582 TaxID=487557 RepID=UPI0035571DE3
MTQRLLTAALLALLLQGCQAPESTPTATNTAGPAATPAADVPEPAARPATAANRPELSPGACKKTDDGFTAFLEAIVADPAVRAAYSVPVVEERDLRDPSKLVNRQSEPFRLTLIDYSWSYNEPDKDPSELDRVKLDFKLEGDRMRVDFVRAEFSADDEVLKTFGAPEAYIFEYTQDCWQLAQHLR